MTTLELVEELAGDRCRCGGGKQAGHTFCYGCYKSLPARLGAALWKRVGQGYEAAYAAAELWLDQHGIPRTHAGMAGVAGVAISEDRKSIILRLPRNVQALFSAEAARTIGEALLDAADELDPPPNRQCPQCGPISVDLSEHTCPHRTEST